MWHILYALLMLGLIENRAAADFQAEALSLRSPSIARDRSWIDIVEDTKRLMPKVVLDRNGNIRRRAPGPVLGWAVYKRGVSSKRRNGWLLEDSDGISTVLAAKTIPDMLIAAIRAQLQFYVHREAELDRILATFPEIRFEVRRNSFEEQTKFQLVKHKENLWEVVCILDPSVLAPARKINFQAGIYEFAGWLVHGSLTEQHVLTARTWMTLLMTVSQQAFLEAYGDLPVDELGQSGEISEIRVRDAFSILNVSDDDIRALIRSRHRITLQSYLDGVILGILHNIDRHYPDLRFNRAGTEKFLWPVVPTSLHQAA